MDSRVEHQGTLVYTSIKIFKMNPPQPNPLELAKQGNEQAIAFLINRSLISKGITAKTALNNGCLQVMLEAAPIPDKQTLAPFIYRGVKGLGVASVQKLKVYGRQAGETRPAWSQEFELSELSENATGKLVGKQTEQTNKTQSALTTSSSSDGEAKTKELDGKDKKPSENLQIISDLVGRALLSRNATVEAEMQYDTALWLKIYPLTKLEPQVCVQTVIRVLNEIQPNKISSVKVSEMATNKKQAVWNKFLILKNGRFVDNTASINITLGVMAVLIISLVTYCALPKQPAVTSNNPAVASPSPNVEIAPPVGQKEQATLDNLTLKVATWNAELAAYKAMRNGIKANPDADGEQLIQLGVLAMRNVLINESEAVRKQAIKDAEIEFIKTLKIAQVGDSEATANRIKSRFEQAVKEYGIFITQTLD